MRDPRNNGADLIAAVMALPEAERESAADKMLADYEGDDKELVAAWLEEAMVAAKVHDFDQN